MRLSKNTKAVLLVQRFLLQLVDLVTDVLFIIRDISVSEDPLWFWLLASTTTVSIFFVYAKFCSNFTGRSRSLGGRLPEWLGDSAIKQTVFGMALNESIEAVGMVFSPVGAVFRTALEHFDGHVPQAQVVLFQNSIGTVAGAYQWAGGHFDEAFGQSPLAVLGEFVRMNPSRHS